MFLLLLIFLVISGRLIHLQVINKHFLQSQGDQRSIRFINIPAHRGTIFDRNGKPLAISIPVTSLWINPSEFIKSKKLWKKIFSNLGLNYSAQHKKITANKNLNFMYLKRHMHEKEAQKMLEQKIPGLYGLREYKRVYPSGSLITQVLGLTSIDDIGISGVELMYNQWLAGKSGKMRVVKDLHGHAIDKTTNVISTISGKSLYLSIDLRLQHISYRALRKAVNYYQSSSGSVVIMNPKNGEILSMVNYPSFNPNKRTNYAPQLARNRAINDQYEPGSTIKAFTVAAALDSGMFNPSSMIDTSPGWMVQNGYTIRDYLNLGKLSVSDVLTKSSNIGVSKMAIKIGQTKLLETLRSFGFGQATGVAFPAEALGYLPYGRKLSRVDLSNIAFGYHLSVSPLQLVRAYSALAVGGKLYPASLLKINHVENGQQVISKHIADKIIKMLTHAVQYGTGKKAKIEGYDIAGKTGTSHRIGSKGYNKDSYFSSFVGIVPAESPKMVILVILNGVNKDSQTKSYLGGAVAAPIFSEIAHEAIRHMGILPK